MKKRGRNRKEYWLLRIMCLVAMLFVFAGCGKQEDSAKPDAHKQTATEESTEATTEEVESKEELTLPRTESLDTYEFEISKHPISNGTDIYQMDDSVWNQNKESVYDIVKYNDTDILIWYYDGTIARLNAVTLEVIGTCRIDEETNYGYMHVNEDGKVMIYSNMEGELYDENLNLLQKFKWPSSVINGYALAKDLSAFYYNEYDSGKIYRVDLGTEEVQEIKLEELEDYDSNRGDYVSQIVVNVEKNQIVYNVFRAQEPYTVVSDLTTGKTIGKTAGGNYWFDYTDTLFYGEVEIDNCFENVWGKMGEEPSYVLSFDYEADNFVLCSSLADCAFLSFEKTEQMNDAGTEHKLSLYNPEGKKQYETSVYLEEDWVNVSQFTYLDRLGVVVFEIMNNETRSLCVWDLCGVYAKSNDDGIYAYPIDKVTDNKEAFLTEMRAYADEIEKKYGVEIGFGEDFDASFVYDYTPTPLESCLNMKRSLKIIDRELARYPKGMLAQLQLTEGHPMWIYLCDSISGIGEDVLSEAGGLQNETFESYIVYLNCHMISDLKSTIHHEIFHSIDDYLMLGEYWIQDDIWNSYNPESFCYDYNYAQNQNNFDSQYVYNSDEAQNGQTEDISFVDIYSKSFPVEDHARVMEYAMCEKYWKTGCFQYKNIRSKLQYESELIRKAFDTTGWPKVTEWEKNLTL